MSEEFENVENDGRTEIAPVKKTYTWEIMNFTFDGVTTGSALQSPSFSVGPNDYSVWCLLLYPNLFSYTTPTDRNIIHYKSKVEVALQRSKHLPLCARIHFIGLSSKDEECTDKFAFTKINESHGIELQVDDIKDNVDRITIICKMTVFTVITNPSPSVRIVRNAFDLNKLSEDFQKLWENEKFSDFQIIADGKIFPVHRNILSARSPVLKALIHSDMKEKNKNSLEINDVDHHVVKELLRYIYTGKVENLDVVGFELLKLADMYEFEELAEICTHIVYKEVDEGNVVDVLVLAELRQMKKLKSRAINFLIRNIKSLIDTPKFKSFQTSPNYSSLYNEIFRNLALMQTYE